MSPTRPPGSRKYRHGLPWLLSMRRWIVGWSHRGLPAVIAPFGIQITQHNTYRKINDTLEHYTNDVRNHTASACNDVLCERVYFVFMFDQQLSCVWNVCFSMCIYTRDLRLKEPHHKHTHTHTANKWYLCILYVPRIGENSRSPGIYAYIHMWCCLNWT